MKMATQSVSRQRRWQLRKKAEGRCTICGGPLANANYCAAHRDAYNRRRRVNTHERPTPTL